MENLKDLSDAIHIQNEYRRVAAPIVEHLKEVSKQFIGKKIDTLKGLSSKFAEAIIIDTASIEVKPLPYAKWANVRHLYVRNSYNDLSVKISLCFSDGKTGCTYEERSWYFGKTENGVLISINDDCKVEILNLDFETELAKIKKFRELEKQMEKAQEKILINREVYKYIRFK